LFPPSVPVRNYNKFTVKVGKCKVVPVDTMKVYRESGSTTLLVLILGGGLA